MNCQSGIVPALSWWELSSQVDVNAAVLSKLGGVTQPFERGVVCYNRAVLFLSSPTSRMTPFLFHQSQAAGNTLHCFHLHHTKSNLQREMMLVRSDFRQLRQLNDKYINFSSHDVHLEQMLLRFSQKDSENRFSPVSEQPEKPLEAQGQADRWLAN